MRHGYNDHFRFRVKNPFLGEDKLIFANGDDSSGSTGSSEPTSPEPEANSIHQEIQEGPQSPDSSQFENVLPGTIQSTELQESLGEYQLIRGSMEYFERINRYLQSTTEKIDLGGLPWSSSGEKIEDAVKQLEHKITDLDLTVDEDFFTTIRNKEESEQRQQMIGMLASLYEKLNEEANEKANLLHELYVEEYIKKYDDCANAWANISPAYADYAAAKKEQYELCKAHLKKQLDNKIDLGDEDALINALQSYKDILDAEEREIKEAQDAKDEIIDLEQLTATFHLVEKKRKEEFSKKHNAYKSKINSIISELNRIKSYVNSSNLEELEKQNRVGALDKEIANYKENIIQSDEFARMSFNDPSFMTAVGEDGEEVSIMIKDKDDNLINTPKGLKDRLDLIQSGAFTPVVTNLLASGIKDELDQMSKAIDGFVDDVDNNLDATLKNLKAQDLSSAISSPTFNSDIQIVMMSPLDIWEMLKAAGESFNRSRSRVQQRKIGQAGSKITRILENLNFGPFQHFSVIPGDLNKKQTSAENEAVEFYKSDYKSNDDNSLIDLMHTARNKDQFKACLELLAERGRLNWFDPILLKQINRFQNLLVISPDRIEDHHADTPAFYQGLTRSLEAIYQDADLFRNLHTQTQSAYQSAKEKFTQELTNLARVPGGLQNLAITLLKEHYNAGENSKVNPQKFEYVIEYGITEGAIQPGELGLYFLIHGAKTGLLPFERLQHLYANKASAIPYLEIFNEKLFDRKRLLQWASIDPIPDTLAGIALGRVPHKFMRWFHTYVMNNPRIRDRTAKVFSGQVNMDSDFAPMFLPYGSEDMPTNVLQIMPNGSRAEDWLINNASQYQLFALHNQLAHMDEIDNETEGNMGDVNAATELQNMLSVFIKWDSIMDRRYLNTGSKKYVRWTDTLKNQSPRSSFVNNYFWNGKAKDDSGNNAYGTTYAYAVRCREIISQLDPEIFSILFKAEGAPTEVEVKTITDKAASVYGYNFDGNVPKTGDELYSRISGLVGAIIQNQNVEGGTLRTLISQIKSQHNEFYTQHNDDNAGDNWGEAINFYPPVDNKGIGLNTPANNNKWFVTGSDSGSAQAA